MSLRKRDGIWQIDIHKPDGTRFRRTTGTSNKKEAQQIHDQIKAACWQAKYGGKVSRTWNDAAQRWLKEKAYKASIKNDQTAIRFFDQFFDNLALEEIDRDSVEDAIDEMETSNATKNRYVACIRGILNKCAEWKWLSSVPKLRTYKESKLRIRWLTRKEAETLLRQLPKHYEEVARFALATGLRMSNVLNLSWDQVDMSRKVMWIHADQAKGRKPIGVTLSDEAFDVLKARLEIDEHLVFQNLHGAPLQRIESRIWKAACAEAKITDFRFHDLRHTWASWHVQAGTPLHVLQEMGGWQCYDMVRRYAHLAPEHLAPWANNAGLRHVFVTPSDSTSTGCAA